MLVAIISIKYWLNIEFIVFFVDYVPRNNHWNHVYVVNNIIQWYFTILLIILRSHTRSYPGAWVYMVTVFLYHVLDSTLAVGCF